LDDQSKRSDFVFHLIESRNIDIIFLAGSAFVYSLLPEIKRRFPRIKVVDQLFNEFGHIKNNRKYSPYIDRHIVANEAIRATLTKQFGESEDKVSVIIHGVDIKHRFLPENIQITSAERDVVPPGKILVSFIGRFSKEKCAGKFVEIANVLRNEDNLHFFDDRQRTRLCACEGANKGTSTAR
jgi:glycosyltransferase involved in cell wall biosynthesis